MSRHWRLHDTPEIFNTDQGAQFTSEAFTSLLKKHSVDISMDYSHAADLRQGLKKFFQYYNTERTHQSLGACTPDEVYHADIQKAA